MHPYYLGLESELPAKYVKAHLYLQFPGALSALTQEYTQRHTAKAMSTKLNRDKQT